MITIAHQHQLVVIVARQRQKDFVARRAGREPADSNVVDAQKSQLVAGRHRRGAVGCRRTPEQLTRARVEPAHGVADEDDDRIGDDEVPRGTPVESPG